VTLDDQRPPNRAVSSAPLERLLHAERRAAIEPTIAPASPAQKIERSAAHQLGIGFGI
jgi:hypothetical protein